MYYHDYDELNCNNEKSNYINDINFIDKGYCKTFKSVLDNNGNNKKVKLEYYTSGGTGSQIRNAETGEYTKYKVGSINEELFFSVIIADGTCKSKNGLRTLFYNDPEQYEDHYYKIVNFELKQKWYNRKNKLLNLKN